jgi:hypothetical protein
LGVDRLEDEQRVDRSEIEAALQAMSKRKRVLSGRLVEPGLKAKSK